MLRNQNSVLRGTRGFDLFSLLAVLTKPHLASRPSSLVSQSRYFVLRTINSVHPMWKICPLSRLE